METSFCFFATNRATSRCKESLSLQTSSNLSLKDSYSRLGEEAVFAPSFILVISATYPSMMACLSAVVAWSLLISASFSEISWRYTLILALRSLTSFCRSSLCLLFPAISASFFVNNKSSSFRVRTCFSVSLMDSSAVSNFSFVVFNWYSKLEIFFSAFTTSCCNSFSLSWLRLRAVSIEENWLRDVPLSSAFNRLTSSWSSEILWVAKSRLSNLSPLNPGLSWLCLKLAKASSILPFSRWTQLKLSFNWLIFSLRETNSWMMSFFSNVDKYSLEIKQMKCVSFQFLK